MKILGICASPILNGNTELFLKVALEAASETGKVDTELVTLSGKNIRDCIHCNWCVTHQAEGRFCNQKDDMAEIYPKLVEADGLLLATPVYFGRLSGIAAIFLDRLRPFVHGNHYKQKLANKVGAALAVSWLRDGGGETTIQSVDAAFHRLDMLVVRGVAAVSSIDGTGKYARDNKHLVLLDEYGLRMAHRLANSMVEVLGLLKAGK